MTSPINPTSPLSSNGFGDPANALTPDALLAYVSERVNTLDGQIDAIFQKQEKAQALRTHLNKLKEIAGGLATDADKDKLLDNTTYAAEMYEQLDEIAKIDPELAADMKLALEQDPLLLYYDDGKYQTHEIEPTREYLDHLIGDLDSTSQMDMIRLQSLTSSFQTANSLGTNLLSTLSRSSQEIASKIGS